MGEQSRDSKIINNAGDNAKVLGFLGTAAVVGAAALGGCGDLKNNSQQSTVDVNPVPMTETINAGRSEVVIDSMPINLRPETPVGVSEYPNAIPEGGIMVSENGKRYKISYDTKIFPTVTYLHYSEAETPFLGEMGPMFELGDVMGKKVYLEPFAAPYGNTSGQEITLDQGKYYGGFIMTAGSGGTVGEPKIGPDGEYIKGVSDNPVPINPDNPSGASFGYWRFALFQATENPDGTTTLSLLGVNRGGSDDIYIKEGSLPENMKGIINTDYEGDVLPQIPVTPVE